MQRLKASNYQFDYKVIEFLPDWSTTLQTNQEWPNTAQYRYLTFCFITTILYYQQISFGFLEISTFHDQAISKLVKCEMLHAKLWQTTHKDQVSLKNLHIRFWSHSRQTEFEAD